jgi:AmiR/NasT family two-component response regulator
VSLQLPERAQDADPERLRLLERENEQLRQALASRIVIEQAKGILAERFRLDLETAFELLRGAARSHRLRIHDLAAAVTTGPTTPEEIERFIALKQPSMLRIA